MSTLKREQKEIEYHRRLWHSDYDGLRIQLAGGGIMAIEFRRGGRKVSSGEFFKGMMDDAFDEVMNSYAEEVHGKAASVVDPA
ncbi:MAG: hypothetical protein JSS55_17395, partial [Proteobacteria bacterium]|nr:hypothetical protein [Pseudomonadota bacterium]